MIWVSRLRSGIFSLFLLSLTLAALFFTPEQFRIIAIRNSVIPGIILLSLPIYYFSRIPVKVVVLLILLTFSADLTRYFRKYNPYVKSEIVFPSTPVIDYVVRQPGVFRVAREKTNLLPPNTWAAYRLESVEGYEPLRTLHYNHLFHLLENGSYFSLSSRFSELEDVNPKFLDALNVKYFFIVNKKLPTNIQQKLLDHGYKSVFTDKSVSVLENPHVKSRAYYVQQVVTTTSEEQLASLLQSPNFQPSKTAVILGSTDQNQVLENPNPDPQIIKHGHNQVQIRASAKSPQFMVLADAYDSGWKAYVDKYPVEIYRVNGALRGIFLPPGDHQIVFQYLPHYFIIGAWISASSLVLLIILAYTKRKS